MIYLYNKKFMETNKNKSDKELKNKLNSFLNTQCDENDEVCLIKTPNEIITKENKKIITSDGRQLLREIY